jgi:tRNA pseudouridine55 synthase
MTDEKKNIFEEGQLLLFDKPLNWTSHDLINKIRIMIRKSTGLRKIKVGHAGTLDPLATGLMIICTGKFTKRIEEFSNLEKEYIATIHLGETTASYDLETEVNEVFPTGHITSELVAGALNSFRGEQLQVPPLFSAKFIDGKRAYEFARKGVERKLEPSKVFFHEIELLRYEFPEVKVRLLCSKGTYIRAFARDLGKELNSGAYLSALQRTAVGRFTLAEAMDLEKFDLYIEQMQQK